MAHAPIAAPGSRRGRWRQNGWAATLGPACRGHCRVRRRVCRRSHGRARLVVASGAVGDIRWASLGLRRLARHCGRCRRAGREWLADPLHAVGAGSDRRRRAVDGGRGRDTRPALALESRRFRSGSEWAASGMRGTSGLRAGLVGRHVDRGGRLDPNRVGRTRVVLRGLRVRAGAGSGRSRCRWRVRIRGRRTRRVTGLRHGEAVAGRLVQPSVSRPDDRCWRWQERGHLQHL